MTALNLHLLAQLIAERAVNCIVEGTVIALVAWILLHAMRRQNSGTRFAVWFSVLLTIAALPLFELCASGSLSDLAPSVHSVITLPASWALYIFMTWAVVAGLALLRVGHGFWQVRRLRASCTPFSPENLPSVVRTTVKEFQATRPVSLCTSENLRVPTAIGFLNPVIVLPTWLLGELPTDELRTVLLHELAHLRRKDDWTNLAQKILRALLFFHPAVWWIDSRLSLEREMACDDIVLAETQNPRAYAECLISVAEKTLVRRGLALAQAAVHRMRETSLRIAQILDVNRPTATRIWKPALCVAGVLSIGSAAWLSHAPEIVAFRDSGPSFVASSQLSAQYSATMVPSKFQPPAEPDGAAVATESKRERRHFVRTPAHSQLKSVAAHFVGPRRERAPFTASEAKPVPPDSESATVIQASARGVHSNAPNPEAIFVVMQAEPCSGGTWWRISVIRFTVLHTTTPKLEKGTTAKSI
jgi:beta-lactamase regulating signal transducer with metallopeptidase domain